MADLILQAAQNFAQFAVQNELWLGLGLSGIVALPSVAKYYQPVPNAPHFVNKEHGMQAAVFAISKTVASITAPSTTTEMIEVTFTDALKTEATTVHEISLNISTTERTVPTTIADTVVSATPVLSTLTVVGPSTVTETIENDIYNPIPPLETSAEVVPTTVTETGPTTTVTATATSTATIDPYDRSWKDIVIPHDVPRLVTGAFWLIVLGLIVRCFQLRWQLYRFAKREWQVELKAAKEKAEQEAVKLKKDLQKKDDAYARAFEDENNKIDDLVEKSENERRKLEWFASSFKDYFGLAIDHEKLDAELMSLKRKEWNVIVEEKKTLMEEEARKEGEKDRSDRNYYKGRTQQLEESIRAYNINDADSVTQNWQNEVAGNEEKQAQIDEMSAQIEKLEGEKKQATDEFLKMRGERNNIQFAYLKDDGKRKKR